MAHLGFNLDCLHKLVFKYVISLRNTCIDKAYMYLKSINVGEIKNSLTGMCFLITPLRHPSTNEHIYETNRSFVKTRMHTNLSMKLSANFAFHIVDVCCDLVTFRKV